MRFLVASREKALCDTILQDNFVPHQSVKALAAYLEEDMRLDMDELPQLDAGIIRQCAEAGRKAEGVGRCGDAGHKGVTNPRRATKPIGLRNPAALASAPDSPVPPRVTDG